MNGLESPFEKRSGDSGELERMIVEARFGVRTDSNSGDLAPISVKGLGVVDVIDFELIVERRIESRFNFSSLSVASTSGEGKSCFLLLKGDDETPDFLRPMLPKKSRKLRSDR